MKQRQLNALVMLGRLWYRARGEQIVVVTFWPNDYRRGDIYHLNGQDYQITRYAHAPDYRFYEVWARAITGDAADRT